MNRAEHLLERKKHAYTMRVPFHAKWREQSDYFRQSIDNIGADRMENQMPNTTRQADLYDTTGIEACQAYAAGCMAWLSPSESAWFKFEPPKPMQEQDDIVEWYGECTEITREILAGSNFYREIHKTYLDDGAFGTSALVVEPDPQFGLNFKTLQIGSYSILENTKGIVDTVFADFEFTAKESAERFGEEMLSKKCRESYADPKRCDKDKFSYTRVVVPNTEREAGKIDESGMAYQVIWIDDEQKKEVRVEGAWEMPILVHRHQCYTDTVWGFGPGWRALPDMKQLNDMQALLDTQVELQVVPAYLDHIDREGDLDLTSGAVNFFSDPQNIPRPLNGQTNYPMGVDRVEWRQTNVRRTFYNHLFQLLSEMPPGKEMTATEIMQRQRDQLPAFSPTFAAKMTEIFNPLGKRCFGVLLRMGAYPEPPQGVMQQTEDGVIVPDPQMTYTSRMALQIEAIENQSFMNYFEQGAALMQVHGGFADHIDWDKVARNMARNEGVPEGWIRAEYEVDEIRRIRQQQEAAIMQAEQEAMNAETTEKLASASQKMPA